MQTHGERSLLLRNGLSVEIVPITRSSKTVFFSRTIRGVELTREQCERLSELLSSREDTPRPMIILRKLASGGYFDNPRNLSAVRDELASYRVYLRPSAINVLLKEMTARKELHRQGKRGTYEYIATRADSGK